ncbi:DNA mismatch endonuclease Vsr [Chryseobacterium sp. G0186]|uniref:very short patch repair endonuclease n=1 Tax=Chryseobacterium sp. G0186 TaxID=2487064 RepID=UPI000F4E1B7E|nr:very short patch repair endonuclease [Chryseobacterium sp. G0186]AZA78548.1 DNA mismatch endonuclease Vsr [Chryseobacterium sp. G0186]
MTNPNKHNSRSYIMSMIKGRNTRPELLVRKFLHAKGLRYRLHPKKLAGKPNIYLSKYGVVVEVRGCFWHGHENCSLFILPKTNRAWWAKKIKQTKERDYKNEIILLSQKIKTIVVWECSLGNNCREQTLEELYIEIINSLNTSL